MTGELVVLVHGLWMPGSEMAFVKHHLEKQHGFSGVLFSYPSVRGTLDENAELLADFIGSMQPATANIVGHSLGGVVALRMHALNPGMPRGRVVCMGSPLCGSRAANLATRHGWGSAILGKSVAAGVVSDAANEWATKVTESRDVGCIAGTVPAGLGRIVAKFEEPSDGTVAVSETRLPGIRDHLEMEINHSGLVVSAKVADQVAAFLKTGGFEKGGTP
ncbi:MAG: alpha/beta hydrolase [Gammaproteobacteria bacterium]|nr:alpha/beta hydrolase [Gammaproteobacteria bacterium]